ncbi:peptide deformylase [Polynucleobacter hirudinilacicola]|uniref:Peptide deformylase n=1 Tax=Polynucleobacter hirudinilacicola TaxID=1743166 RepID=A0A210RXR1_9BURK|nr:peptide deformylase [Polynucleobacter hirudinilacicola]OWF65776.1 peptide deformylase [Polynucleobacter hirudinilacicola]
MPVRSILKMGDPRLLQVSLPIQISQIPSFEIQTLIDDMLDTMHSLNGAGLAAPQIGVNKQLVVFGFEKNLRYPDADPIPETIMINPSITIIGDQEEDDWEGCLSVPGIRAKVPRYQKIRYSGYDRDGAIIDRTVEGFHARVVQHECDHLIGKLFPMRVKDFSNFGFTEVLFPSLTNLSLD